jgi:hypothetical protein
MQKESNDLPRRRAVCFLLKNHCKWSKSTIFSMKIDEILLVKWSYYFLLFLFSIYFNQYFYKKYVLNKNNSLSQNNLLSKWFSVKVMLLFNVIILSKNLVKICFLGKFNLNFMA